MSEFDSCTTCGNTEGAQQMFGCRKCFAAFCARCSMPDNACPECWKSDHVQVIGSIRVKDSDSAFEYAFPSEEPEAKTWSDTKRTPARQQPAPMRIK